MTWTLMSTRSLCCHFQTVSDDLLPSMCDLVDQVEDEDDGDDVLDVKPVHLAKEAHSGRQLIRSSDLRVVLQGS